MDRDARDSAAKIGGVTRDEYLAQCKERAHEYVKRGDLLQAVTSMSSDLSKHPDFQGLTYSGLLLIGTMFEVPRGPDAVRRWIDGFN